MGFVSEFKSFLDRGNAIDLAVGVIIGGAFGKIVSSLVADLLMPPIGLALAGVKIVDLKLRIGGSADAPVTINYGSFLESVVDFVLVGLCVFLLVKIVNGIRKPTPSAPPAPPPDIQLLTEIRDLLKPAA